MNSHDIERRLRLPAPDEPAVLPALTLPSPDLVRSTTRSRVRAGSTGHGFGLLSPRLAVAILALVLAMVAAIAAGALRLELLTNLLAPNTTFIGRGVEVTFPRDWIRLTSADGDETSSVALIASSAGVTGCSASELAPANGAVMSVGPSEVAPTPDPAFLVADRMLACIVEKPMAAGEIRLVLSRGIPQTVGVGPIEPFDPADWYGLAPGPAYNAFYVPSEADGWTRTIDGMPAKLVVGPGSSAIGADETRTWAVYEPHRLDAQWFIRATIRGPDLDALRAQADAVAQSLRFTTKPPPLDEAVRDQAVTKAIDQTDREWRGFQGSKIFGCFPRTAGERDVVLEHGPQGPLLKPLRVTCRTTVERTPVLLWHATLVMSWAAGASHGAGEWGYELYTDTTGELRDQGYIGTSDTVVFPGSVGELPPRLTEPLVIPIGSIVEVLSPGIVQSSDAHRRLAEHPNDAIGMQIVYDAAPGSRFAVVGGPVANEGTDWYLVEWSHGTFFPPELAWLPATNDGRPLLGIVEPSCPTGEVAVTDLLDLIPAERVQCLGDKEIALDPAILAAEANPAGPVAETTPAWLATDSPWRLFGSDGPAGVDGSIPIAISPEVGEAPPTNVRLRVVGHFDDPAAATCHRTVPEGWGGQPDTPLTEASRCRELFVITSFERTGAP